MSVINRVGRVCLLIFGLFGCAFAAGAGSPVIINEFMARNGQTLADEDGVYSDWIELRNLAVTHVSLDGWYLTDSQSDLAKWRFPAVVLPAGSYLVVFASGKDRAEPGAPLHTNFQLDGDGEYLALVQPDRITIASEFDPMFPEQLSDIAYGNGQQVGVTPLIRRGAPARVRVPGDGALGSDWTSPTFSDAAWLSASTGIGFEVGSSGPATGLFSYWPIDEGSGDSVGNEVPAGAAGSIQGANWVVDGVRGTVLSFDGVGSYVSAGTVPFLAQSADDFSWSFWYYQRAVPNINCVVLGNRAGGSSSPLQFVKFTPTNFEYYRDGHIGTLPYEVPTGRWLHLAVVKRGSNLTYYGDGAVVATSVVGGDMAANPFFWGGDPGAPGEFADGMIDDVSLWSVALSGEEITLLAGGVSPLDLQGISSLIATDIADPMLGFNPGAYVRIPFQVADGALFNVLTLHMSYDDGFAAYLNGVEVARRNAPAVLSWESTATAERTAGEVVQPETIDLSAFLEVLENGANVLAIHGLNSGASDPDFLVLPELEGLTVEGEGARYLPLPTPGAANDTGFLDLVDEVVFSHERGFYDSPFQLALTCSTPGATIRYTTNGTMPALEHGATYGGPISIGQTTALRAAAFKPGYQSAPPGAQTYIFLEEVLAQEGSGLPSAWGDDWQMDPRVVEDPVYAGRIREDMKSLPVVCITMDPEQFWGAQGIYTMSTSQGVNYERPCSAEMFFPDGAREGFQINCGIRIAGGASRSPALTPKHGVRLLFKTQYGASKLRYRFFEDTDVEAFDSIAFRPNFNMSWVRTDNSGPLNNANADGAERTHAIYVRDQFTKDSYTAMGQVGAHERFVHLYLNGIYWGLYNPCERTDASFAATYWGGEKGEYDAIFSDLSSVSRPVDGDKNAWNTMLTLAGQGLATPSAYTAIQSYLDVTNLADYMMLNFYCSTVDWPWQNWNALRKREANAQFRMIVWDAEYTLETPPWVPEDRTGVGGAGNEADSPARLYYHLRQNPEWRMLFADRAHLHFFNEGALTAAQTIPRFEALCDQIDRAIVCESARWGDVVRQDQPYTRNAEWLTEKRRLLDEFFPDRTEKVIQQLRVAGLYPWVEAPTFSRRGGLFTNAMVLEMTAPVGSIYCSTNGSDPRLAGGGLAPGSWLYTAPITLNSSRQVRARVLHTNAWSALNEAVFVESTPLPLLITEIMYHPEAPPPTSTHTTSDFEFVEIKNTAATAFDAQGVRFTAGLAYAFSNFVFAPGQLIVLARNRAAFVERYGNDADVLGEFVGTLDNGGERIRLEGRLGEVIQEVPYADWYPLTDGFGFSLVPVDPTGGGGGPEGAAAWRVSAQPDGSPGRDDPTPSIPPVVINEILTHTDPPQVDSIELHNPLADPVDISGWFLSDELDVPHKYRIPDGTVVADLGYVVFTETDFNPTPGMGTSFALDSTGDEVWLFSADASGNPTGYLHGAGFGAAANGISFGRCVNSVGEEFYPAQIANTLGATNAGPRIGPVVINEILYHPVLGQEEYVEIHNITATNVPLFDLQHPENTWELSGFKFTFPPGTALPPRGIAVVSRIDPDAFRAKYRIPPEVQVFGPSPGVLQNDGENLELQRPDNPNTNGVPYITVDAVRYGDVPPWPTAADGTGASLQRRVPEAYGNDPANWFATGVTPGHENGPNVPPAIELIQPTDQSVFGPDGWIQLEAWAQDSDGFIRRVEFFVDGQRLGEVAGAPYVFDWGWPDRGVHVLTARAIDDQFTTTESTPIMITVVEPAILDLIPAGSEWRYLVTATEPTTSWAEIGYDDSTWPRGRAELGYGDGDETTVIGYGGVATSKYITTYFRQLFTVIDTSEWTDLRLRVLRDDGVVIYLNGSEIVRDNLPPDVPIRWETGALQAIEDSTYHEFTASPTLLRKGINVLAAEVHQANPTSSDVSFDLQFEGTWQGRAALPRLEVQQSGNELILFWPNTLTGYTLESSPQITGAAWSSVDNVEANHLIVSPDSDATFYRLHGP